jgi:hypothetical protein
MSDLFHEQVFSRFATAFGDPKTDDAERLAEEFRKALAGTSREVLRRAVDGLIKTHRFPTWPTIGDLFHAVQTAGTELAREAERLARPWRMAARREPTPEERERVADLVRTAVARIAEHQRRIGNRPVLDALYEHLHGAPWPARNAIAAAKLNRGAL